MAGGRERWHSRFGNVSGSVCESRTHADTHLGLIQQKRVCACPQTRTRMLGATPKPKAEALPSVVTRENTGGTSARGNDADKTGAPLGPLTALSTPKPGTSHGRLHAQKYQSPRDTSPVSSGRSVGGRRNEGSSGTAPEDGHLHLRVGLRAAAEALVCAHSPSGNTCWAKAPTCAHSGSRARKKRGGCPTLCACGRGGPPPQRQGQDPHPCALPYLRLAVWRAPFRTRRLRREEIVPETYQFLLFKPK